MGSENTHVGPADHVDGGEVHGHEGRVLDNLVGQVDAKGIAGETEAEAHCAVLAAERLVRLEVEHLSALAEVGLYRNGLDVVLAVLDEPAVRLRAAVLEEARGKPAGREGPRCQ